MCWLREQVKKAANSSLCGAMLTRPKLPLQIHKPLLVLTIDNSNVSQEEIEVTKSFSILTSTREAPPSANRDFWSLSLISSAENI